MLKVYPNNSTLAEAIYHYQQEKSDNDSESDDDGARSIDSSSSIDDLVFDGPLDG